MTNPKNVLSVALTAATLAAVLPFLRETAKCYTLQKPGHQVTLMNPCTGAGADTRVQGGWYGVGKWHGFGWGCGGNSALRRCIGDV